MKIIEQGGLEDICKVIHISLEGEMNWNQQYLIKLGCEAASIFLEDSEETFPFAIESGGIIDEIISLLNKLPIENIRQLEGEGKPNPLLKEMEKGGTLSKLIKIFQNDKYEDNDINTWSACSIGSLFKALPLPIEFGPIVINYLKDNVIKPNNSITLNNDRNLKKKEY
ncbi:MAG: hypothetical protein EZS28_011224 [Streblomastix strix]|uniref:Uncharacterized protein n=1 Tax=Streblomastix strix TaxID=222440 RepID=A0A5J4WFG6_9EUKA|nr:MAG: hypothetical protein EZS28_011224 [Streblomastix strix]